MEKSTNHEFRYRAMRAPGIQLSVRSLIKALVMLVAFTLLLVSSPVRVHDEVEVSFQTFSDQLAESRFTPETTRPISALRNGCTSCWDLGSKAYPGRPAMRLPGPAWNIEVGPMPKRLPTRSGRPAMFRLRSGWRVPPSRRSPPRPSSSCQIRTTRWTQIMTIPKRG